MLKMEHRPPKPHGEWWGVLFTLREEDPLGSFGSISPGDVLRRICRKSGPEPRADCGIINYSRNTAKKDDGLDRGLALEMRITCHRSYATAQERQEELKTAACGIWGTEPHRS